MNRVNRLDFKKVFGTINRSPFMVTFLSGKGGVGKSIVTYNTAAALARSGHKTLLIDADWDFGSIHLLANAGSGRTLYDIIVDGGSIEDNLVRLDEKLYMISSPAAHRSRARFIPENYLGFLETLKENKYNFDFILLDTPSSHLEISKHSAFAADINLMVINPEITSMANSYGLFKFLHQAAPEFNAHIFVNRVQFGKDSEYMYQKFAVLAERFLGKTPWYAGYLHENQEVTESVSRQKAVAEIAPESETAEQFLNLCNFLTKEMKARGDHRAFRKHSTINSRTSLADIKG